MSEVLVYLLLMEGAVRSCSSTWLGGANGRIQEVVQEEKYTSRKEGNFEQKSVIGASLTIANIITSKVQLVVRVMDLANIVAKK